MSVEAVEKLRVFIERNAPRVLRDDNGVAYEGAMHVEMMDALDALAQFPHGPEHCVKCRDFHASLADPNWCKRRQVLLVICSRCGKRIEECRCSFYGRLSDYWCKRL